MKFNCLGYDLLDSHTGSTLTKPLGASITENLLPKPRVVILGQSGRATILSGVGYWVYRAGFFKTLEPELATIAQAAGATVGLRIVATPG